MIADLNLVHEAAPVPTAQQAPHKGLGLKALELVHVLSRPDEDDGRLRGCHC